MVISKHLFIFQSSKNEMEISLDDIMTSANSKILFVTIKSKLRSKNFRKKGTQKASI